MSKLRKHSGGILFYSVDENSDVWVFLVKENGPRYWKRKDGRGWSIPKGRKDKGETIFNAAQREFTEEIGIPVPRPVNSFEKLAKKVKKKEKLTVYMAELMSRSIVFSSSNTVVKEYPKGSGRFVEFQEIAEAKWLLLKEAKKLILPRQKKALKKLEHRLS